MGDAAFFLGLVALYALLALGAGWLLGAAAGIARRWWSNRDRMSSAWRRAFPAWADPDEEAHP
jgi:hypothetical protein